MKTSTPRTRSSSLRIAVAVAILAGAGLSGCVGDPFYDNNRGYSHGYNQPAYQSQRYYDNTGAQGNYYDPNRPVYTDRPYYYQQR